MTCFSHGCWELTSGAQPEWPKRLSGLSYFCFTPYLLRKTSKQVLSWQISHFNDSADMRSMCCYRPMQMAQLSMQVFNVLYKGTDILWATTCKHYHPTVAIQDFTLTTFKFHFSSLAWLCALLCSCIWKVTVQFELGHVSVQHVQLWYSK